jgi:hypothetical protein
MSIDLPQLYKALISTNKIGLDTTRFISHYHNKYSSIVLGSTFRPESFSSIDEALHALDEVHKLGIKEIRTGIRWSRVEKVRGELQLEDYFRVLDKMMSLNMNITLNLGPIKSAGWPEQFIPEWVHHQCEIHKGDCIDLDHDLATHALEYLELLCTKLSSRYPHNLRNFVAIQPENECFKKFGKLELTSSESYLARVIEIINNNYPNIDILLNSSGRRDMQPITQFINNHSFTNQFILGFNYYFVTDSTAWAYPYVRYFDDFVINDRNSLKLNYQMKNLQYEVSECQFEKWGRALWAGQDIPALKYALLRCGQASLETTQSKYVIRLWGIEELCKRILHKTATKEQKEIIKIIQSLDLI